MNSAVDCGASYIYIRCGMFLDDSFATLMTIVTVKPRITVVANNRLHQRFETGDCHGGLVTK